MKNLMITSKISISYGITFTTCIVWKKNQLQNLVGLSMKSSNVSIRVKMMSNTSVGFRSVLRLEIKMDKKFKNSTKWWNKSTVNLNTKSPNLKPKPIKALLQKSNPQNDHIKKFRWFKFKLIFKNNFYNHLFIDYSLFYQINIKRVLSIIK